MSGAGSQLHFRGALALPNDNEPSLIVDLRVDGEVVVITQDSEQLGSWPVEDVDAERLNGQRFRLRLGDDEVIFHARDRLGFAYNGLSAIREAKERLEQRRQRSWLERLMDGDTDVRPSAGWVSERLASIKNAMTRNTAEPDRVNEQPPAPRPSEFDPPRAAETPPDPATPDIVVPDDAVLAESFDPGLEEAWGLPSSAMRDDETVERGARHRSRSVDDARTDSDDPWAIAADAVLRRDPPSESRSTARQRKRRTKRDHVHAFDETRLPGGLVRRVCSCGEVVIRSVD